MKRVLVAFAILLMHTGAFAELPPLIPREVLFGNPTRELPKISPDGKKLAFLAPSEHGVLNLWVRSIDKDDPRIITDDRAQGLYDYTWAYDNQHILYKQDTNGDENDHIKSVDLKTLNVRDLTSFAGVKAQNLLTSATHPDEILVGLNLRDRKVFDMYRVNLKTGALVADTENPGDVLSWTTDNHFQIRAATVFRPLDLSTVIRVRDSVNSPWRDLVTTPFEKTPFGGQFNGGTLAPGFTPDDNSLYVVSAAGTDTTRLVTVDIKTGRETGVVAEDAQGDLLGGSAARDDFEILFEPKTGKALAAAFEYFKPEYKAIDPAVAEDIAYLKKQNSGVFTFVSKDAENSKWIVDYWNDVEPDSYHLYDRGTQKLQLLFVSIPGLKKENLAETKPIVVPARDGMQLVSYLTLPVGVAPKNLPMVLLVHGGPWFRDSWYFNPYLQWFANRGWAVLQVNFRGSAGLGLKYLNAGTGGWGTGKMQDDLTDSVKWAIAQGIADPKRIAIFGGSYGGYATLSGITFTPDLYACAVDEVGPSDVGLLLKSIPAYWGPVKKRWIRRIGGDMENDAAANEKISPLYHVEKIRVPLLIGHGANDPRVNLVASEAIVKAMRSKNLPVTFVLYPDEGHGFYRPENKLDFNGRTEEFLGKCLGGRIEPFKKIEGTSAEVR